MKIGVDVVKELLLWLNGWRFGGEFFKVSLGQHLRESLEKVLCKTHLERTLTRVKVLKTFW